MNSTELAVDYIHAQIIGNMCLMHITPSYRSEKITRYQEIDKAFNRLLVQKLEQNTSLKFPPTKVENIGFSVVFNSTAFEFEVKEIDNRKEWILKDHRNAN